LEDAWKALNLRRLRVFKLEQEVQALERAHELYHQLPKQVMNSIRYIDVLINIV
jgi:hypothetical protein